VDVGLITKIASQGSGSSRANSVLGKGIAIILLMEPSIIYHAMLDRLEPPLTVQLSRQPQKLKDEALCRFELSCCELARRHRGTHEQAETSITRKNQPPKSLSL